MGRGSSAKFRVPNFWVGRIFVCDKIIEMEKRIDIGEKKENMVKQRKRISGNGERSLYI